MTGRSWSRRGYPSKSGPPTSLPAVPAGPAPGAGRSETPTRRTFVTIEVEMGLDDEWHQTGLEEAPESADQLLAQIKAENRDDIPTFIGSWDLDTFVTVRIEVAHNDEGKVTRSTASWSQP